MTASFGPLHLTIACLSLTALPRAQEAEAEALPDLDVTSCRRALRHADLLENLAGKVEAAKEGQLDRARADLALVRLEAQLLQRIAPLDRLTEQSATAVLETVAALPKSANEELVLARLSFCVGDVPGGETALGRARDADPELKKQTDELLAEVRKQRVPRGGYFRYRGAWMPLAERDYSRALDRALDAIAAVKAEGVVAPLGPDQLATDQPNRPTFEKLGEGVGEAKMRKSADQIRGALQTDYASVRGWLLSYAKQPKLSQQLVSNRQIMRLVQREAIALIQRYTKMEQDKVDDYRARLRGLYDAFAGLVDKDFAGLYRLDPAEVWQLHQRLERREGALTAIDTFFRVAKKPRLPAGEVRPTPGSTVTTTHLLPGRHLSGLEDTLWLVVKQAAGQTRDVLERGSELLRHQKKLTPWELVVIEALLADAIDDYNERMAASLDAVEWQFIRVLNDYRRTLGLQPFEVEERLNVCSSKHSQEMVDLGYVGHMSPVPRNRGPSDRARLEGYAGGVGENCLGGRVDGRGAFEGWYHSPGHHRGMISTSPHTGIGAVEGHSMWTMVMGGSDMTWRTLHPDMPPAERKALQDLVDEFVTLVGKTRGRPSKKLDPQIAALREKIAGSVPQILPDVARVAFAAARDRKHPAHGAFPRLLGVLIEADVPTTWRALQIAAVASAIEAMRFGAKPALRKEAWLLVQPLLSEAIAFDPSARNATASKVNEVRKHWEDVAQWRFRAAPDAAPPPPRIMPGRSGDGPSVNAPLQVLSRKDRQRLAKEFGGSSKTEQAVEMGLQFLASVQDDDGAWRARSFPLKLPKARGRAGAGSGEYEIAMTGLSLLAFSSAGYSSSSGLYAEQIDKGARFLMGQLVDYGKFDTGATHYMYNHALGAQALCEVYAYSGDPVIGAAAQLATDFLVYAQHAGTGGWRYQANEVGDSSVSGWVIMALNSAFKAKLDVSGFRGAHRFLDSVTLSPYYEVVYMAGNDPSRASNRLAAVAMTGRLFVGAKKNDSRLVLPAFRMMEDLPRANKTDFYYWYYATLALFQLGDPFWKQWNEALKPTLLDMQDSNSSNGLKGSWAPRGQWSGHGGRLYMTSLGILMLTTYYRYDRAPKIRLQPFTGDIAKAVGPMLSAIEDETDDMRQRIAMRKVVDSYGSSLVGPVVRVIRDDKEKIGYRRRLASLLVEVAEPQHAGILAELMATDDGNIATSAARAFVQCSSRRSVPLMLDHLNNKHRNVRAFTAQALGEFGEAEAIAPINARLSVERDGHVKASLEKALLQLGRRNKLTELLARALPDDTEGYLAIVNQLEPLGRHGLLDFVQVWERDEPKLDERALEILAEHQANSGIPLLLLLMEGPDADGRDRAVKLLRSLTRKDFGYDPVGTPKKRRAAIQSWEKWWKKAARGYGQ